MEQTNNNLYINQQKLINKLTYNNEIIRKLNNDINELLIINIDKNNDNNNDNNDNELIKKINNDMKEMIILIKNDNKLSNIEKKEKELIEIIKNQELIIEIKRNKYNLLL